MISPIQRSNAASIPSTDAAVPSDATAAATAPLLPAPDSVAGDPLAMIAKLLVKGAQQTRENDGLSARAEEKAEDAADAKRIEAMKDKAEKTMIAGILGGMSQIASGAGSLVGGLSGLEKLGVHNTDASRAVAGQVSRIWEGAGSLGGGVHKIGEAAFKSLADSADRDVARAESDAKLAKRAQDALNKEVDAAAQHQGKVMQLLQEIKQAQAQCERAALLRMA